jgi:hypothetical protein
MKNQCPDLDLNPMYQGICCALHWCIDGGGDKYATRCGGLQVEGDLSIGQLATIGSRTIGDFEKPLKTLKYER